MKAFSILYGISLFISIVFGQSNTPCASGLIIAPPLLVGPTCSFTNGTTNGATAQNNAANGGNPSCGSFGPDVWYSFVATGPQVVIQTQAGTITDGVMALYSGSCGSWTQIACDDNSGAGLMPLISATGLTVGQTYLIRFWEFGGGTGTFQICASAPALAGTNTTCTNQTPICSGSPITFTANAGGTPASTANPGNNYGCLATTPNPSWYYLQIATGGTLRVDISAGSDVDFAIWGPFPSVAAGQAACNSYGTPLDCSYSTAATEQVNVPGTTTGQVYVLLVTNYASIVQNISVNNGGGTATTNCAIVPLPVSFSSFEAYRYNRNNEIKWSTASEINCDYYLVDRSLDGNNWLAIGGVEATGTTQNETNYSFTDKNPPQEGAYYRLKQVDLNGDATYTAAKYVEGEKANELTVYPNPSKEGFSIGIDEKDVVSLQVKDQMGRMVNMPSRFTNGKLFFEPTEEQKGIFIVHIEDSKGRTVHAKAMVE